MIFVLGCSLKSCLFKCSQNKLHGNSFFLMLGMCFVKSTYALSLFYIVKGRGYFIMIVVSFMKFGCHVYVNVYGYWYTCLLLSLLIEFMHVHWYLCMFMSACSQFWLLTCVLLSFPIFLYFGDYPFLTLSKGDIICWCIPSYMAMHVCLFGVISCMLCFRGRLAHIINMRLTS